MRIAFHAPMKPLDDPTPSGERRLARLFVEALERGGWAVDIPSRLRSYDRGDPGRQARLEALGSGIADRILARYAAGCAPRPDLWFTYHVYHKAPDHLGPRVSQALGIPYVIAEASHAPKQAGGRWDAGYLSAERAIRAADRIFCLNPADVACLALLVKGADTLRTLPPFIDTAPFRADAAAKAAARQAMVAAHGFDPGAPLILSVAMMRRDQKLSSYAVLAEALMTIERRRWNLLVVGSGPAEPEVRRLFARFGGRAGFAGRLDGADLARAYAAADIFAWPAVKEAFGMAFVEAAAAGLATVAGRSGGIDHIVEDGRTGLVVEAGDAMATGQALGKLLEEPLLAAAMGRRAAERALAVNDMDAASAWLSAELRGLLSRQIEGRAG